MPVFSDDSFPGRAIHQCLDISHYLLGAALVFVRRPQESINLKIVKAVLLLPVPLVCKAICQRIDSKSPIYKLLDSIAQIARIAIKFAFVVVAFAAFPHIEPGKAQLLGFAQLVGRTMPLVYDTLTTIGYLISRNRDFYLHIKWSW
ncbi:MAG TPA: hypothetical protein VFU89_05735 [Rhabdochlamydiaceae bacterium]|nr:hypothetical protein [Rhabdochlamydiaceae bacterium]